MEDGDYQELVTGPIEKSLSALLCLASLSGWMGWVSFGRIHGLRFILLGHLIALVMIWAPRYLAKYRSRWTKDETVRNLGWALLGLLIFGGLGLRLLGRS